MDIDKLNVFPEAFTFQYRKNGEINFHCNDIIFEDFEYDLPSRKKLTQKHFYVINR